MYWWQLYVLETFKQVSSRRVPVPLSYSTCHTIAVLLGLVKAIKCFGPYDKYVGYF